MDLQSVPAINRMVLDIFMMCTLIGLFCIVDDGFLNSIFVLDWTVLIGLDG